MICLHTTLDKVRDSNNIIVRDGEPVNGVAVWALQEAPSRGFTTNVMQYHTRKSVYVRWFL